MITTCTICRGMFEYEPFPVLPLGCVDFERFKPTVCNACDDKMRDSERAAQLTARFTRFQELCPAIYAETDLAHPDMPPTYLQSRVLNWKMQPTGLMVVGETRKGKTRLMWLLLKRLILEGRQVRALTSSEFARECADSYGQDGNSMAWFDPLANAEIVFIDDLGKFKLTERVECELFDLIEYRTSHCLPLFFTSNSNGAMLLQRMSEDRGPAIIGRIREFCTVVTL